MKTGLIALASTFGLALGGCWDHSRESSGPPISGFSIALGTTDSLGRYYRLRGCFDVNYCIPVNNAGFSEDCGAWAANWNR